MRADYLQRAVQFVMARVKFIDESGINLGLTRLYGRATPGQRVGEAVPSHYGAHLTLVAALGVKGISAPWVVEGAVDGAAFEVYLSAGLGPTLEPGDIVVMDNLSVHQMAGVQAALNACGARLEYLPPYSPDFNPIEQCWSKIKTALRAAKARAVKGGLKALKAALRTITEADARAWFVHCGYPIH